MILTLDAKVNNKSTRREGDQHKKTRKEFFVNDPIYGSLIFSVGYPIFSIENSHYSFNGKYYRVRDVKSGKMDVKYIYFQVF